MSTDGGLRPLFRQYLEPMGFHLQSVETGITGGGVPDTNYCVQVGRSGVNDGAEGWIEYKQTRGWTVTLRPAQVGWIARRVRAGGRVLIAVRRFGSDGCDDLYLLPGHVANEAKAGGLRDPLVRRATLGVWQGGPTGWDWAEVAECLRG